jgi:ATP-dependent Lhr-like helicase
MIEKKYLRDVDGLLLVGEECEKIFLGSNYRRLFAVFDSGPMYDVWDEKKHVGTLDSAFVEALETPFLFVLGGIEWEAFKVKSKSREVFAKKTKAGEAPKWITFSGFDVPYETAKEAGRILFGTENINYLNPEAQEGLQSARDKIKRIGWSEIKWVILTYNSGKTEIWTFAGDRINRTLAKLIINSGIGMASSSYQRVFIKKTAKDQIELKDKILKFLYRLKSINIDSIGHLENELSKGIRLAVFSKFVRCLPENLWYEAISERIFDFKGLIKELKSVKFD